jgi:hypothetical protein
MSFLFHANQFSWLTFVLNSQVRFFFISLAFYACWHFWRIVLEALAADLLPEINFVDQIAECNPKNALNGNFKVIECPLELLLVFLSLQHKLSWS